MGGVVDMGYGYWRNDFVIRVLGCVWFSVKCLIYYYSTDGLIVELGEFQVGMSVMDMVVVVLQCYTFSLDVNCFCFSRNSIELRAW